MAATFVNDAAAAKDKVVSVRSSEKKNHPCWTQVRPLSAVMEDVRA